MFRLLARSKKAISTAAVIVIIVILVIAAAGGIYYFSLYQNIFKHFNLYAKHNAIDDQLNLVFLE